MPPANLDLLEQLLEPGEVLAKRVVDSVRSIQSDTWEETVRDVLRKELDRLTDEVVNEGKDG